MEHKQVGSFAHTRGNTVQVTLTCSCGTKARSERGWPGAWQAFNKHVKRAAAKDMQRPPYLCTGG
jgi:hypothetical protein